MAHLEDLFKDSVVILDGGLVSSLPGVISMPGLLLVAGSKGNHSGRGLQYGHLAHPSLVRKTNQGQPRHDHPSSSSFPSRWRKDHYDVDVRELV